ncbi:MAG: hypothetical protein AB7P40_21140 [Chloroflexota bacterium]
MSTSDRQPKSRYSVGAVMRQFRLLSMLPDALRDWLVLREIGQPTAIAS